MYLINKDNEYLNMNSIISMYRTHDNKTRAELSNGDLIEIECSIEEIFKLPLHSFYITKEIHYQWTLGD